MSDTTENSEYTSPVLNAAEVITGNTPGENVSSKDDSYVRFQIEEMLKTVRTGMPGIVQSSFERDESVWLKVQPALSSEMRTELGGDEIQLPVVIAPLGVINVAGFTINLPTPVQGDEVWIICADRNIGSFTKQGGVGIPATNSILSLNNAYCLPFSTSNVMRKRVGDDTDLTITGKNGNVFTMLEDGKVSIKNDSYSLATLIDDLITILKSLTTYGSPTNHTISTTTVTQLENWQSELDELLEE